MFHWICPECGREISPQAQECAACDPSASAAAPREAVATPNTLLAVPQQLLLAAPQTMTLALAAPVVVTTEPPPLASVKPAFATSEPVLPALPKPTFVAPEAVTSDPALAMPAPAAPEPATAVPALAMPAPAAPEPITAEPALAMPAPAAPEPATAVLALAMPAPAAPEAATAEPATAKPATAEPVGPAEIASSPEPAPLEARVSGAPQPPASALPLPVATAGADLSPVTSPNSASPQPPVWPEALPAMEPARGPRISQAPLREPQPASSASIRNLPKIATGPESSTPATAMPSLANLTILGPPLAGLCNYAAVAASQIKATKGLHKPVTSVVKEQLSLPGPTLPHELTSLHAAGVAQVLVAAGAGQIQKTQSSNWALSVVVAAAVLAGTLGGAFYAMPGFASSSPGSSSEVASKEAKASLPAAVERKIPTNPLARLIEVTGIRFVTDVPDRPAQIHYLVVNHSNVPLIGVTVNVTLRTNAVATPLSQFTFRAPRLGPYESKEMVSSIERISRPVAIPDWRSLETDIDIAQ